MIGALRKGLGRFRRGEDGGTIAIEFLLMAPLLIWAVAATVVFFDGFRSRFLIQKSTSTIADAISRETNTLDPDYIGGMSDLLEIMTPTITDHGLRVSLVEFNDEDDTYSVVWSAHKGSFSDALKSPDLTDDTDRLPLMADEERYVLVETSGNYDNPIHSLFGPILSDLSFYDAITISPRFNDTICYTPDGNVDNALCRD